MTKFQELQERHLELLGRFEHDQGSAELLSDVQSFVEQVRLAGKEIGDSRERNQLRANLRFWGAFIYEQAGTYPNLELLPSETAAKPFLTNQTATILAAVRRRPARAIGLAAIGGLCLVLAVLITLTSPLTFANPGAGPPTEAPTGPDIGPVTEAPTGPPLVPSFTPAPTSSPMPSPSTIPTETPVPMTPAVLLPAPRLILGAPALIPVTGGRSEVDLTYEEADCFSRSVSTHIFPPEKKPTLVRVLLGGSGEIAAQGVIAAGEETLEIDLPDPVSNQTYLLKLENPGAIFQPVILQYLSNCTRNQTTITLGSRPSEQAAEYYRLELALLTWGAGYDGTSWIAKLRIETDHDGLFWLSEPEESRPWPALPIDDSFFIEAAACGPAEFIITETTGGYYVERWYTMYSPMSFCEETP